MASSRSSALTKRCNKRRACNFALRNQQSSSPECGVQALSAWPEVRIQCGGFKLIHHPVFHRFVCLEIGSKFNPGDGFQFLALVMPLGVPWNSFAVGLGQDRLVGGIETAECKGGSSDQNGYCDDVFFQDASRICMKIMGIRKRSSQFSEIITYLRLPIPYDGMGQASIPSEDAPRNGPCVFRMDSRTFSPSGNPTCDD